MHEFAFSPYGEFPPAYLLTASSLRLLSLSASRKRKTRACDLSPREAFTTEGGRTMHENALARLFELEPAEDPPCDHEVTRALPDGWQELVSEAG